MALYTFYCCQADGVATTFEARELASDAAARDFAAALLPRHSGCAYVSVFDADREVLTEHRATAPGEASAGASPATSLAHTQVNPVSLARALGGGEAEALDIALIVTTFDGAVAFWNPAATRLYGWREEAVIGRPIVEITPATSSKAEAEAIMRVLQRGEPWAGELMLRHRDGRVFPAFVADIPVGALTAQSGMIVGASAPAARREAVEAYLPALLAQVGTLTARRVRVRGDATG